jgi:alkylation response protein AidB-like acyl-CoA dehydrogenase
MSGMTAAVAMVRARRIADEILFPSAMNVDSADRIPAAHLDALADAGLYGLAAPVSSGGLDVDLTTLSTVVEILASGCLATTFVWIQHHSTVRALARSENSALRAEWLGPLSRGARRAGIALGGARPGPPLLRARAVPGGYVFDGTAPWVTGWDMIDVVHTLARDQAGNLIAALLPAKDSASLAAARLDLVAVNASRTVELAFASHFVPSELVSGIVPHAEWLAWDAAGLRINGSLSLGVAARCCQLIEELAGHLADQPGQPAGPAGMSAWPRPLADKLAVELATRRAALDAADPESMPAARAAASELVFRAAGTLVAAAGSHSIVIGEHPQRLAREALFLLVFGSRPAIKESLIGLLTGEDARSLPP